jgi:hypothetical protein
MLNNIGHRSTPTDEVELIPYCSSVTFADPVKTEILHPSVPSFASVESDHCYIGHHSDFSEPKLDSETVSDDDDDEDEVDEIRRLKKIVQLQMKFEQDNVSDSFKFDPTDFFIGAQVELKTSAETKAGSGTQKPESTRKKKKAGQNPDSTAHVSRSEADKVSEAVKDQALAAIQDLQARGAATDELTCRICDPAKSFTAYTTLLTHLRSHAQIRLVAQLFCACSFYCRQLNMKAQQNRLAFESTVLHYEDWSYLFKNPA